MILCNHSAKFNKIIYTSIAFFIDYYLTTINIDKFLSKYSSFSPPKEISLAHRLASLEAGHFERDGAAHAWRQHGGLGAVALARLLVGAHAASPGISRTTTLACGVSE